MKTFNSKKIKKRDLHLENVAKYCDKCGAPYDLENLQIVQESSSSIVMHFFCEVCKSENIASFFSPVGLTTKIPINCDLDINELKYFSSIEVVSLDDVLEVYTSLEKNKGSIVI